MSHMPLVISSPFSTIFHACFHIPPLEDLDDLFTWNLDSNDIETLTYTDFPGSFWIPLLRLVWSLVRTSVNPWSLAKSSNFAPIEASTIIRNQIFIISKKIHNIIAIVLITAIVTIVIITSKWSFCSRKKIVKVLFPSVAVCGSCSVWELRCVGIASWWSCGVGELLCGEVAV